MFLNFLVSLGASIIDIILAFWPEADPNTLALLGNENVDGYYSYLAKLQFFFPIDQLLAITGAVILIEVGIMGIRLVKYVVNMVVFIKVG